MGLKWFNEVHGSSTAVLPPNPAHKLHLTPPQQRCSLAPGQSCKQTTPIPLCRNAAGSSTAATVMLFDEQRGPHSTLNKTGPNQITLSIGVTYGFRAPSPKCTYNFTVGARLLIWCHCVCQKLCCECMESTLIDVQQVRLCLQFEIARNAPGLASSDPPQV
jgi:hypothetical protein